MYFGGLAKWFRQESHSKVQSLRQCNECCSIRSGDFDGDYPTVHECAADQTDCYIASNCNIMVASGRTPDSQSSELGFESPFATVTKIGHFRSLH